MKTQWIALAALLTAVGCSGNPVAAPPVDGGGGGGEEPDAVTVPVALADAIRGASYNAEDETLQLQLVGIDSTPLIATYDRRKSLDVPGYQAFTVQEDGLDRMFIAMARQSPDGSVRAVSAADGGQFNRYFGGGYYERTGDFDRPDIATGPGAGQVSYAGTYAGVVNGGGTGDDLIPPPPGTDPTDLPQQPARVSGDMFLNANFGDNLVNGSITNRVLVDQDFELTDVILLPATITENGTFEGTVEGTSVEDRASDVAGSYGGVFGGVDSAAVGGAVYLTEFEPTVENEEERGVFVLTQCGQAGDAAVCDGVAPQD